MEAVKITSTHSTHKTGGAKEASSIANPSGQTGSGDFMSMLASVETMDAVVDMVEHTSADLPVQDASLATTDLTSAAMAFLGGTGLPTPLVQTDTNMLADASAGLNSEGGFFVDLQLSKAVAPENTALTVAQDKKGHITNFVAAHMEQQARLLSTGATNSEPMALDGMAGGSFEAAIQDLSPVAAPLESSQASPLADGPQKVLNKAVQAAVAVLSENPAGATDGAALPVKGISKRLDAVAATGLSLNEEWKQVDVKALSDIKLDKADIQAAMQQSVARSSEVSMRAVSENQQQWLDRGLSVGGGALQDRLIDAATGKREALASHIGSGVVDTYALFSPSATADTASSAGSSFANQLSEQVTYWVNQKVQNAAFTMDRDGEQIEVSVAISGLEAQVSFRTDQAQTREMLDSSTAQLKELLLQQGLSLTGVSIGEHRQPSDQAPGGRHQFLEDAKRRQVHNVVAAVQAPLSLRSELRTSGVGGGHSLDVFA